METSKHTAISICDKDLDPESERFLLKTASWAKFLAVAGFTFLGIFIVGVLAVAITILATNSYMENTPHAYSYVPGTIGWLYVWSSLTLALIYFFPLYYLYRFSVRMKQAIPENNHVALVDAFRFLSRHYTFIGVLTLAMMVLLAIMFLDIFIHFM